MKFYAQPYSLDAQGFYFETYEEFTEKLKTAKDSFGNPVEEFEFQVIDGTQEECELVKAVGGIDQGNIENVIDFIDTSDEDEWPVIFFLLDNNICDNLEDAKSNASDYSIVESSLLDAATELFDECWLTSIPKEVARYIDYESFANDCRCGGDMVEFEFGGKTYTCTNANQ